MLSDDLQAIRKAAKLREETREILAQCADLRAKVRKLEVEKAALREALKPFVFPNSEDAFTRRAERVYEETA